MYYPVAFFKLQFLIKIHMRFLIFYYLVKCTGTSLLPPYPQLTLQCRCNRYIRQNKVLLLVDP